MTAKRLSSPGSMARAFFWALSMSALLRVQVPPSVDRDERSEAQLHEGDCNVYVASQRAGQRIMGGVTKFLWERLKITVNAAKSAVARSWGCKFLGYSVTVHKETRLRIAPETLARLRARITDLCLKGRGQRLAQTIEQLRPVLRGWMNYFQHTQGRRALKEMDAWVRRRMPVIAWRQ